MMLWFDGNTSNRRSSKRCRMGRRMVMWALCTASCVMGGQSQLQGAPPQPRRVYHPLNQRTPPGVAAFWNTINSIPTPGYYQPIRVQLPSTGKVRFFTGGSAPAPTLDAPSAIGVVAGHSYRFQISNMPEFPGIELFPSLEVLDRLHPPAAIANRFPIPVRFLEDEIDAALRGQMITKVVYLEQPQIASSMDLRVPDAVVTLPVNENVLAEADHLGRPLLIIRLGARQPSPHRSNAQFMGRSGPLRILEKSKEGGAP
ncbi:MAG: hypothetical protein ABGZ17_17950 [Planctomycetaceae bacterium]